MDLERCTHWRCREAGVGDRACKRCSHLHPSGTPQLIHRVAFSKRAYCHGCARYRKSFARRLLRSRLKREGASVARRKGYASIALWRKAHRECMARKRAVVRVQPAPLLSFRRVCRRSAFAGRTDCQLAKLSTELRESHPTVEDRRDNMAKQGTVRSSSGEKHSGTVVRERSGVTMAEAMVGVATLGMTTLLENDRKATVRDENGKYWSGRR